MMAPLNVVEQGRMEGFLAKGEACGVDVGGHLSNLVEWESNHVCEQKAHDFCCLGKTRKVNQLISYCFQ
jgi:hypothetical protein